MNIIKHSALCLFGEIRLTKGAAHRENRNTAHNTVVINGDLFSRKSICTAIANIPSVPRSGSCKNWGARRASPNPSSSTKSPAAHIVFAGDGPYRTELESELEGLDATFTGYINGEEHAQLYASCDCLVFPSTTDTFGKVVLEAQAVGIAVIVTDKGGPRENMLNDETGFMVPADDAEVMAEAMQRMANDPDLRTRMGQAARIYMSDRDFENAFRSLYDMYTADWGDELRDDTASMAKKFLESTLKSAVV